MKRHLPAFIAALLCVALFGVTVFWLILPHFQTVILDKEKGTVRELTHSAWSMLESYQRQVEAGVISRTQAEAEAISRLRMMRHGPDGQGYFWISDMQARPTLIMHPFLTSQIGRDVSDFADSEGKLIFKEFARIAREEGAGWATYRWAKQPGESPAVPKVSYVMGFKPWGWVVGTGIYLTDVAAEQAELTNHLALVGLGMLALIALFAGYLVWRDMRALSRREAAESALAETEGRFRMLVEQSPISIEIYDLDGTQRSSNQAWARLWQVEPDSAEGSFNVLKDVQTRQKGLDQGFLQAAAGETVDLKPVEFDPGLSGLPGRARTLHTRMSPLYGADGQVRNVVVSHEDITDLVEAEAKREEQVKLEGVMELAGTACHELNQPLQALVSTAELLQITLPEDRRTQQSLKTMLAQLDRLAGITRRLQNITRYETMEYAGRTKIIDLKKASGKN